MSKYVLFPESEIGVLRNTIKELMTVCAQILKHLDSSSGTLNFDQAPPSDSLGAQKPPKFKKLRSGKLIDALLAHVPNEPVTTRQAYESLSGHYKFRGRKGRGMDSVRHTLRTSGHFTKREDGRYQRKEFQLKAEEAGTTGTI